MREGRTAEDMESVDMVNEVSCLMMDVEDPDPFECLVAVE